MPKNIKAAPPQQSSLKEMWGKRKHKGEDEQPDASSGAKNERVEVDGMKIETGKSCIVLVIGLRTDEWRSLESVKHEESPPRSEEMDVDQPKSPKSRHFISITDSDD
jgi:hypothetical protein